MRKTDARVLCSPPSGHLSAAQHLEFSGAVSVVDAVAKRSFALGHVGVAAQNVRVLGSLCGGIGTCIGPGAPSIEVCRFVLICEEGLVPPINKEFR